MPWPAIRRLAGLPCAKPLQGAWATIASAMRPHSYSMLQTQKKDKKSTKVVIICYNYIKAYLKTVQNSDRLRFRVYIAMENPNHKWRFRSLGKSSILWAIYTMAMLNNQRVHSFTMIGFHLRLSRWFLATATVGSKRPCSAAACRGPFPTSTAPWHARGPRLVERYLLTWMGREKEENHGRSMN